MSDASGQRPGRANIPVRLGVAAKLRAYFFAGALVTAPLVFTIYLAWLFIAFVDGQVLPLIPAIYNPETYLKFSLPGLGLLIVVVALILVGALTAGFVGRSLLRLSERLLARMPVVRSVYSATKQIVETVLSQHSNTFRQVAAIEYPRRGVWALAFVSGPTEGEIQNRSPHDLINVFIPTTPNPTSGFLLFVPREDVHILNMSVEEGAKLVVSAGIVTPPDRRPQVLIESQRDIWDRGSGSGPTVPADETAPTDTAR